MGSDTARGGALLQSPPLLDHNGDLPELELELVSGVLAGVELCGGVKKATLGTMADFGGVHGMGSTAARLDAFAHVLVPLDWTCALATPEAQVLGVLVTMAGSHFLEKSGIGRAWNGGEPGFVGVFCIVCMHANTR